MIFKNNYVKNGELIELFSHHFVGNYIPITMIFHSISWFFFEANDFGHHLLNITFHLFNGYLVYQIGKILFKKDFVATIGVAIFLLHPLQIETVAWISELKNCLSTSFYLIATLFYLKYLFTFKMKDYLAVIVFFIASCLSKPSAIIFPLILLIIDVLIKNKIEYNQVLNKMPLFFISIVFGIINLKTQSADLFINHAHEFPFYQRIAFAGFALFKYLVLFLFPFNQSVIYPYPNYHLSIFLIGYFIIAIIIFLLIYFIKNKKYNWLFMIFFSLLSKLLPEQGGFRDIYNKYISKKSFYDALKSRETLKKWVYDLEKIMDKQQRVKCKPLSKIEEIIEQYRAGCGGKTPDNQPTCRSKSNTKK
jgi:hypothetical protein